MASGCSSSWLYIRKKAKKDHIQEGRKVGRSNATPIKLFPVDSYDLKSIYFKFGNYIFITFEMARSSYQRPIGKINISVLFCPSASEVLALLLTKNSKLGWEAPY